MSSDNQNATVAKKLQFQPLKSHVGVSFWNKFSELKLKEFKLNDDPIPIWGYYSASNFNSRCQAAKFEVDSTSFNKDMEHQVHCLTTKGWLVNYNTWEEYKGSDRKKLVKNLCADGWWYNIDKVFANPMILNMFVLVSYADVKNFKYHYWFCFPCVHTNATLVDMTPFSYKYGSDKMSSLTTKYHLLEDAHRAFFVVEHINNSLEVLKLADADVTVEKVDSKNFYFAFSDPCQSPLYPGWHLRNYIVFVLRKYPELVGHTIQFLSFRLTANKTCKNSLIFSTVVDKIPQDVEEWLGWQQVRGRPDLQVANLEKSMSPHSLAEASVDLNLKLMKWQLAPSLDLDKIKSAKCLILGAGTLGCSVARSLAAWGVLHITLVDNKKVSYSNPVRQNLYTFEDSRTSEDKSTAAAKRLKEIYPSIVSEGHNLSIPMPGHPANLKNELQNNFTKIQDLIQKHDIIFLLMDSRESRWLPSVLGRFYKKIVITAALGYDSYVVMRHGSGFKDEEIGDEICLPKNMSNRVTPGNQLGCYFCSDITAPGNSSIGRTLDKQCTVTRPGVSNIASGLAAELAVSILQHPLGINAPAFTRSSQESDQDEDDEIEEEVAGTLGVVFHSIRGYLWNHTQVSLITQKYDRCIACSDIIMQRMEEDFDSFLQNVFESGEYLLKTTGIHQLNNDLDELVVDFDTLTADDAAEEDSMEEH